MATKWCCKKTGRPLPQAHDITCTDDACTGCYGDGRWGYVRDEDVDALDDDERMRAAIDRFLSLVAERIRETRSKDLDDYGELLDAVHFAFTEYMETAAARLRGTWKARGIKPSRPSSANATIAVEVAKRAARALVMAKLRDAGLISLFVMTFIRWVQI
jgi:hypothetical protein